MKLVLALMLTAVAVAKHRPGGFRDVSVSPTDEPVAFAVGAINEHLAAANGESASSPGLQLVKIVHAKSQVVAGQKLHLSLQLTGNYLCNVTVWFRAWYQDSRRLQVTNGPSCTRTPGKNSYSGLGQRKKRSKNLVGGISKPKPLPRRGNARLQEVRRALEFAACAVNDRVNNMFALTLANTVGVTYTQQVTSGMTYRFQNVPMVSTKCRNQGCSNLDLATCPADPKSQVTRCNFQVQFQAWMEPSHTLTKLECLPDSQHP